MANPGLTETEAEEHQLPTSLKIGLPFTPTLGCRIDFHGMSLSQLTPSKLLAEKLVFSPVPAPKRSLGAISEESTMDIGKELDRYQLELENSINEAKLRKNGILTDVQDKPRISLEVEVPKDTQCQGLGATPTVSLVVETDSQEVVMQEVRKGDAPVERRLICTRRRTLTEISEEQQVEEMEEKEQEPEEQKQEQNKEELQKQAKEKQKQQEQEDQEKQKRLQEQLKEKLKEREREKELQAKEKEKEKEDVVYASEESEDEDLDDLDFKAPARFVRAYRPSAQPIKAPSKESLQSIGSTKSTKSGETKSHGGGGVKNMIRKSIRRLMHPTQHTSPEKAQPEEQPNHGHHHNIINTIRHSLRRRPQKMTPLEDEEEEGEEVEVTPALPDISIIDTSERTMKLRSSVAQTEYMTIEQLTNEKKHTLRNSIRRSTRDVLRHVLFHKSHDAYATAK